jgi:hypothetical protein
MVLLMAAAIAPASAQEYSNRIFSIGGGYGFPLGNTADFVKPSGHFVVGGGGNFNESFGLVGEFMLHKLSIKQGVITQLNAASATAVQTALTLNAVLRRQLSDRVGIYGLGGGGWYWRSAKVTLRGTGLVPGTACSSFFILWGVNCVNGLVPANQQPTALRSSAAGANAGLGFTVRLGQGNMKFFTEVRYHHGFHDTVATQLIPVTFGMRWD